MKTLCFWLVLLSKCFFFFFNSGILPGHCSIWELLPSKRDKKKVAFTKIELCWKLENVTEKAFLAMKIFRNATFRGFHGVELLHLISKTKRTEKEQSINTMISTSQSRTVSLSLAPQPTVEQCRGVSFSPIVSTSKSRKYLLRIRVINSQNWRTDSTT